jgi:hypothetical protein
VRDLGSLAHALVTYRRDRRRTLAEERAKAAKWQAAFDAPPAPPPKPSSDALDSALHHALAADQPRPADVVLQRHAATAAPAALAAGGVAVLPPCAVCGRPVTGLDSVSVDGKACHSGCLAPFPRS